MYNKIISLLWVYWTFSALLDLLVLACMFFPVALHELTAAAAAAACCWCSYCCCCYCLLTCITDVCLSAFFNDTNLASKCPNARVQNSFKKKTKQFLQVILYDIKLLWGRGRGDSGFCYCLLRKWWLIMSTLHVEVSEYIVIRNTRVNWFWNV